MLRCSISNQWKSQMINHSKTIDSVPNVSQKVSKAPTFLHLEFLPVVS